MISTEAFETVNPDARSAIIILCDHASRHIPADISDSDLGLGLSDMQRHIAYDVGAAGAARIIGEKLAATMIFSRFSRLVIDANRGADDPTLVMRLYDGTIIPGNRHVGAADVASRLTRFHQPYHAEIRRVIADKTAQGLDPVLVSIHSFKPRLRGRGPRPWHVGVLWGDDGRLARPLLDSLRQLPGICVGDNEPYAGQLPGDTLHAHGLKRGLLHVLIEFRHDLIADAAGQNDWAQRILPALTGAIMQASKGNADG